jgi:hypothetical protein
LKPLTSPELITSVRTVTKPSMSTASSTVPMLRDTW